MVGENRSDVGRIQVIKFPTKRPEEVRKSRNYPKESTRRFFSLSGTSGRFGDSPIRCNMPSDNIRSIILYLKAKWREIRGKRTKYHA